MRTDSAAPAAALVACTGVPATSAIAAAETGAPSSAAPAPAAAPGGRWPMPPGDRTAGGCPGPSADGHRGCPNNDLANECHGADLVGSPRRGTPVDPDDEGPAGPHVDEIVDITDSVPAPWRITAVTPAFDPHRACPRAASAHGRSARGRCRQASAGAAVVRRSRRTGTAQGPQRPVPTRT